MANYSTATLVRKTVNEIVASPTLTDAEIDNFIVQAMGIMNGTMGRSFSSTYADNEQFGSLTACATAYAAMRSVVFDTDGFDTLQEAIFVADALWDTFQNHLELLRDPDVVRYLET